MIGRFSRTSMAPAPAPAPTPAPIPEAAAPAGAPAPDPEAAAPSIRLYSPPAMLSTEQVMLDVKVRLHAKLIEEIDLAKLDKLDEGEMRRQVRRLTGDFARAERLALNNAELDDL